MATTTHTGQPYQVIFVLGPPGSGKGTQCTRLQEAIGVKHLSAGELLRAERDTPNSKFGQLIESHITNGTIVPVEITCKLLETAMDACPNKKGFLVDGFPRNQNNLDGWREFMSKKAEIVFVLYLSCPEEICIKRCLSRNEGRTDDNEESLRKRIKTYHTQTLPIIEYYRALNLVKEVPAIGTPDEVYAEVERIFKENGM